MGPAISKARDTKLVAVCDVRLDAAQEFASRHGVERTYDSLEKMLEDPEMEVLLIATPNNQHAQQTLRAAKAGRHVLCEKPMALTVPDCDRMIEACEKHRVKLGVDFQNRYHPAHIEARRLIQSGAAGEISMVEAKYCRGSFRGFNKGWRIDPQIAGAGALMGQGLHPIDLLRFLLNSEVEEVRALTDEAPPLRPVDDMNYIILTFDNGTHGVVISGILAPRPDNDAVLYGDRAKIICKGTVGMWLRGELIVESDASHTNMTFPSNDSPDLYIRVVDDFNRCILENSKPEISGENGLQMVRITNAVLESSRQARAVRIEKER
jgi:predicted dehydrogenase